MSGALLDTPGPETFETFRKKTEKIQSRIRIHRVLACARQTLSVAISEMEDRVGPSIARNVANGIEKELSILLAQKRVLADKYDVKREFAIAVKGIAR